LPGRREYLKRLTKGIAIASTKYAKAGQLSANFVRGGVSDCLFHPMNPKATWATREQPTIAARLDFCQRARRQQWLFSLDSLDFSLPSLRGDRYRKPSVSPKPASPAINF
jgi:hypothetical protein